MALPYTYHLTTVVKPESHEPFHRYKLESLEISSLHPGFCWTALVRAEEKDQELWFTLAEWDSEDALDAAGTSKAMADCVERHQPYRYMVTTPAFREVVNRVADESFGGDEAGALHTVFDLRNTDDSIGRFAAWERRDPEPGIVRRIVLQVRDKPTKFYELLLLTKDAEPSRDYPRALLAGEPLVRPAELLLVAP